MSQKSEIDNSHLLKAQIIWGAFVASLWILVMAAQNVQSTPNGDGQSMTPSDSDMLFPVISIALFIASYAFTKLGSPTKKHAAPQHTPTKSAVHSYLKRMFVHCALHEAAVIPGFLAATLSKTPEAIHPYVAAAVIANLLVFPSAKRVAT